MDRSDPKRIRQILQAASKTSDDASPLGVSKDRGSARLSSKGNTYRSQSSSSKSSAPNETKALRENFMEKLDTKYTTSMRSGRWRNYYDKSCHGEMKPQITTLLMLKSTTILPSS